MRNVNCFLLIAYYTQLFRHQEVWLKVKVTMTSGLICKYQKLQCNTQMEVGKKNHLHLISGMILNRNQSLLMRMTMYKKCTCFMHSQSSINVHIRSEQNPYEIKYV